MLLSPAANWDYIQPQRLQDPESYHILHKELKTGNLVDRAAILPVPIWRVF